MYKINYKCISSKAFTISKRNMDNIFLYINFIAFFPISGLEEIFSNSLLFPLVRLLCCSICIFKLLKSHELSKCLLYFSLFLIELNISTVWNSGNYWGALYGNFVIPICACAFIESNIKKGYINFLYHLYIYFAILILLNLITLYLFPEGLYLDDRGMQNCNFILGNTNSFIVKILPALCIGYHLAVKGKVTKVRYLFLWVLVILTYLRTKSVTSIAGVTLYALFLLFLNHKYLRVFTNPILSTLMVLAANIILLGHNRSILTDLLANFAGKNITWSGRTILWDKMISQISSSCWIGFGVNTREKLIEQYNLLYAGHAHNLLLQIISQAGIIGIILFAFSIILILYQLAYTSNDKISRSYGCTFSILFIMSLTEFYGYNGILPILLLISVYCVSHINSKHIFARQNQYKDYHHEPKEIN